MRKSFKQSATLLIIRVGRRLFYKTPVQRNKYVDVIYKKIFRSAFAPGGEMIVEYRGKKYYYPSDDITMLPSLLNNSYEKTELNHFEKNIQAGMTVVDVGANVGIFSVVASDRVGKNGVVYSFEPEPSNFNVLVRNLKMNSSNNVTPINKAIGSETGTAILFKEKGSIGTHTLVANKHKIHEDISVDVITIDDFFKNKSVDIMKVDVEGFELQVLSGAQKTLEKVSTLFFEYNFQHAKNERSFLEENLKSFNKFYLIDEIKDRLVPTSLNDVMSLHYANIVAVK